jgi:hypothetical protein
MSALIAKQRYDWQRVQESVDKFVADIDSQSVFFAWMKAQLIIEAQSRFYSHVGNSVEDAVSMAWEDFEMACKGRGEPGITGAILHMWSRIPAKNDRAFKRCLEVGFAAARFGVNVNALRYRDKDYMAKVHTLNDGFDDPEAIPITIVAAAPQPAAPTKSTLKDRINKVTDFSNSPFSVITGGKDETPEAPDDVF